MKLEQNIEKHHDKLSVEGYPITIHAILFEKYFYSWW